MHYLTEAFSAAASIYHAAVNLRHTAGCFMMRAMVDNTFLTPPAQFIPSKNMQKATDLCQWAVGRGQNWLLNTLQENGQNGGVKPDFKRGAIETAQAALPLLSRINWASPIMLGSLFAAAAIVASYTLAGTHGADLLGSFYSSTQRTHGLTKN